MWLIHTEVLLCKRAHLRGREVGVGVRDAGGDGLDGARDGAVGDVRAADVVHGGGVSPVGVDAGIRVVRALVRAGHVHGGGAVVRVREPGGRTQD